MPIKSRQRKLCNLLAQTEHLKNSQFHSYNTYMQWKFSLAQKFRRDGFWHVYCICMKWFLFVVNCVSEKYSMKCQLVYLNIDEDDVPIHMEWCQIIILTSVFFFFCLKSTRFTQRNSHQVWQPSFQPNNVDTFNQIKVIFIIVICHWYLKSFARLWKWYIMGNHFEDIHFYFLTTQDGYIFAIK